ncbi:MAG: hypothetical protein ACI8T1_000523 [Verrucomicrobiales bacterium]
MDLALIHLDMGSSFDLFDPRSHASHGDLTKQQKKHRRWLPLCANFRIFPRPSKIIQYGLALVLFGTSAWAAPVVLFEDKKQPIYTHHQRCRKLFSCLGVGFAQSRGGLAPGSLAVDKVA